MEVNTTFEMDREFSRDVNLLNIILRSSSVVALVISIGIFLSSRNLYSRDNVKIHINLFVSNILMDVSFLYLEANQHNISSITDILNLLNNQNQSICETEPCSLILHRNESICKTKHCVINSLRIYFNLCNYSWMSCEAFYLCYLIYRVWFDKNIVLKIIQAIGWGTPVVLTGAFIAVTWRHCDNNPTDWLCMKTDESWSYNVFLTMPAHIFLALNAGALTSIAVYLTLGTAQLPQSFKRGFRSLAILTPLLGVHHIVLEYVPRTHSFTVINAVVSSSQGLLIATIFCFTHGDVRSEIKRKFRLSYARRNITSVVSTRLISRFRSSVATASVDSA